MLVIRCIYYYVYLFVTRAMESKIPLVQAPGGGLGPLPPGPRLEGRRGARRSGRGAAGAGGALGELRALTAAGGKGRM